MATPHHVAGSKNMEVERVKAIYEEVNQIAEIFDKKVWRKDCKTIDMG